MVPPLAPVRELKRAGYLEVRGAEFRYPGAESAVLRDISIDARPGETTAIIGSTGSGKTTLLTLIPLLSDATDGSVLVDGVDVRDLDPVLLARFLYPPHGRFLDIGCGTGALSFTLLADDAAATGIGVEPAELALAGGRVFVAGNTDHSVVVLDVDSGRPVGAPIPVGLNPTAVTVGAGHVWVAGMGDNSLTRIAY